MAVLAGGQRLQQQGAGQRRVVSASGGAAADVKTDTGVEGNTINLGVLTDLTGVFAALGKDITNANTMYWKQNNKVCGKYDVKLDVQDTGYVPQTGRAALQRHEGQLLAMQQTIGSPINTALAPSYTPTRCVNFPSAWAADARPRSRAPGSWAPRTPSRSPTATTTAPARA